jgi:hypothetical protein
MNVETVLWRLRRFLLLISALVFIMTLAELVFLSHWKEPIQFLPFALSGLGLIVVIAAYMTQQRTTLLAMRYIMIIIAIGGVIGFLVHVSNNFSFQLEIKPSSSFLEIVKGTLEGAIPILAPGILTLGAFMGLAAIYQHPALANKTKG